MGYWTLQANLRIDVQGHTKLKKNNITELTVLGKYCTKVMVRNCACSTIVLLHVCVYIRKKLNILSFQLTTYPL